MEDNGGHGVYVHGPDSNAGIGIGINAVANGGWGIYGSSFLGNTYMGCHTSTNRGGAYKIEGGTNFSVLMGCYSESDQTASVVHQVGVVVGGDHGAGFADPLPQESRSGLRLLNALNVNGFQVVNPGQPGVKLGIANQVDSVLLWQSADDSSDYRLRYQADKPGWWDVLWANSPRYSAMSLSGGNAVEGPGHIKFPRGYYLGNGNTQQKVESGASVPIAGNWQEGDRIYNTAPTSGSYIGWVCTVAGTPGIWKPFGLIAE